MTKAKRTGECFTLTGQKMVDESIDPSGYILVHGLPMGQGGEAAKVGRYPHAWIEHQGMCWEPSKDCWYPKDLYYAAGEIEDVQKYTIGMMRQELERLGTYGPWSQTLLDRDKEIDAMGVE